MEELLAVLAGTGAVVFSPFLIPGLRPIAKAAIKSGMAAADAVKVVAVATTEGCRDVANRASTVLKPATRAVPPEGPAAAEGATTGAEAPSEGEVSAHPTASIAVTLTPVVSTIAGYGHTIANAAAGIVAQAGKQWSQIVSDAQAELKAEEAPYDAQVLQTEAPASVLAAAEQAPVSTTAIEPWAPAAVAAEPVAAERVDDLEQIDGIGPKVASVLREAGITTFDQLAATDAGQLRALLVSANPRYRMFDPTPWPAEARRLGEASNN
jgi:predicted flap endonuclease-1-like 5' DNA nuclease